MNSKNKKKSNPLLSQLKQLNKCLILHDEIEFSFLFGSQARGDHTEHSDWDIAILFKDNSNGWDNLGKQEDIRHLISVALEVEGNHVDIVDLYRGGLGINATVVDEGIPITGQNSLALAYYYQRIWANLEDFYWNFNHVS